MSWIKQTNVQVVDANLVASNSIFRDLPSATFGFGVCHQSRVQLHNCQLTGWGQVAVLAYGTGTSTLITGGIIQNSSKAAVICHDSATLKARSLKAVGNQISFMAADSAAMRLFNCTSEDVTPYAVHASGSIHRECCTPAE